jgi:hypothetical protein
MDSDRVLVLDAGAVAEYGPPSELLALQGGAFAALVAQTGTKNAEHLRKLAAGGPASASNLALAEGDETAA